jgi:flagellar basal-body rod protein FlgC
MALFGAFGTAGSGLSVHRKWLDALSDNISNINTATPTSGEAFRARYIMAQSLGNGTGEGGVQVTGIALGSAEGRVVFQPDHPLADADGNVRLPDIDLGDQMTQLIMAQRGYQANLAVVDRARNAYEAALQLGRNI